jgi:biopolymer transport protein ExbD
MAFASFDRKSSQQPMAEINMVPLIDVVLVLLVIFIVTALRSTTPSARPAEGETADIRRGKIEFAIIRPARWLAAAKQAARTPSKRFTEAAGGL